MRAPALLLLLLAVPALAGEGETPPPPPQPPAPPAAPPGEPAAAPKPEGLTIPEAFERLKRLRAEGPLPAGAMAATEARIRALGEAALSLPEARAGAGEDLYRLGELGLAARRYPEAAAALQSYLRQPDPRASDEDARAALVRALARGGKTAEAAAALEAYRAAWPRGREGAAVTAALADALVRGGDLEGGLARFRESRARAEAAGLDGIADPVQGAAEVLLALGRTADARKETASALALAEAAGAKAPADPGRARARVRRLSSLSRRIEMVGLPFPPPRMARWVGGPAPDPAALRGKVVVWHFFAPWLEARLPELASLQEAAARLEGKGVVAFALAHTAGWRPGAAELQPRRVKAEDEAADIERLLPGKGWKGRAGIAYGRGSFEAAGIRGFPAEVVVGRDGLVRFVRVGGESGHSLTLRVLERAAAEAPPEPLPGATPPEPVK